MPNRVCILTTVHPPFDTRIFYKQAKTLVKAGYDVTLIAQHDRDEVVDGVRIMALPKPQNRLARIFSLTLRAFWRALRQRADIYHFHDPELLSTGIMLKLLTRAKTVYDVHEDIPQQILTKHWVPVVLRRPIAWLFGRWEKLVARFFDVVVVATEGIGGKFARYNPVIVHNYPSLEMLPKPSQTTMEGNEKTLVYVGGISKLRGAFEMIRAVEHLTHIEGLRLDLIGRFEPPGLEGELQALRGYERVCFLGWLPPEEVYRHLAQAGIGLVCLHPEPRYTVSLPVKLLEYMAAGLPVVAANFPLWKEIVEGNECGLTVSPLDPEEIAQAIDHLFSHPEEARRMGENGRRAVEEKYNWEREGEKLLELYEELLGS